MARYLAFRHTQTPAAKPILTFVARAEDIRLWAGVPHKTTDFVGGFQRPLSDRFKQIISFFDEQGNTSPTAIVVALRPGAAKVTPLALPSGIETKKLGFNPEWVLVELKDPPVGASLSNLAAEVYAAVEDRIKSDVADADEPDEEEEEIESSTEDDVPVENNPVAEWGVDVGKSALKEFAERIKSDEALNAFVANIAAAVTEEEIEERIGSSADAGEQARTRKAIAEARLREVLESLLKPAMIVDGQHRVWGAAESEHPVAFTVCALEEASWRDQVFQFVVINKQARAISSELLASIVNSSLTNFEIQGLEDQLEAAGISTYETKILRIMNDDPDSPFQGLVSRGLEETSKKITFKAAIALASRWNRKMTDRDPIYRTIFRPSMKGTNNVEKLESWGKQWKDYMFGFWNAVKKLYEKEQLWEPGTQLMYRAAMEVLQENFLKARALAGQPISDPVTFREAVADFYENVPAGFFATEWKRKELLTDDGRGVLAEALNAMRVPGSKLATLKKGDPLFTGAVARKKK